MPPAPDPMESGSPYGTHREIVELLTEIVGLLREWAQASPSSPGAGLLPAPAARPEPLAGPAAGPPAPATAPAAAGTATGTAAAPAAGSGRLLTRREQQILDSLLTGASNRVIARELGIAERTVKNNLHAIYRKLNLSGRAEAMARLLDHR
jgi:DNA-binding CsgD family transcriptional regulator